MKTFFKKKYVIALAIIWAIAMMLVDFCLPNYLRQTVERTWLFVSVPVQRFNLSWDAITLYKVDSIIFQIPEDHSYELVFSGNFKLDDNSLIKIRLERKDICLKYPDLACPDTSREALIKS